MTDRIIPHAAAGTNHDHPVACADDVGAAPRGTAPTDRLTTSLAHLTVTVTVAEAISHPGAL